MTKTKLLWANAGDIPSGWPLLNHTHPFFHMFYIRSGKATFWLNGCDFSVENGTCLIVPPDTTHELPEDHDLLDLYEVKFSVLDDRLSRALAGILCLSENTAFIARSMEYIVHNWNGTEEQQQNANMFLYAMLLAMTSGENDAKVCNSAYIETASYSKLIQSLMELVEELHTGTVSLDLLAHRLDYNKRYLCSVFKKETGITILDYLNHIRIRHAVVCFYYINVPISDIAQCVGFITPGHFARVFKQLTGVSPSCFRATHSLQRIDACENLRLVQAHISPFEMLLDSKILPLQQSMDRLKELGRMAAAKDCGQ